jgi:demethylmenaquinone methyltransferase / 2-methoxy-6-polyprenyl-1,4-benzoquinol methylase
VSIGSFVGSSAIRGVARRLACQIPSAMSRDAATDAPEAGATDARSARKRHAVELFRGLPRRYDLLSALLSFGQDPRWRRALVRGLAPAPGERVLDVATGTGLVAAALVEHSGCSVVGIDQSEEMLSAARARFAKGAARGGAEGADRHGRVELLLGEAERLPFADRSFDALTFTYLLRYVDDPRATMRELARVLRPGGRIASVEFGVPPWPVARSAWRAYAAVGLPLLGGLASPQWREVGRFLGPSIADFYERHPLEQIVAYWHDAGLREVRVRRMSLGGGVLMFATRACENAPGAPESGA